MGEKTIIARQLAVDWTFCLSRNTSRTRELRVRHGLPMLLQKITVFIISHKK
jgi:hypothetical protein